MSAVPADDDLGAPTRLPTPFSLTVWTLRDLGWQGALPLPHRAKSEPPGGWTGGKAGDRWPSGADVHSWLEESRWGNIGIRLPDGVVGIDVDQYAKPDGTQKRGAETMAAHADLWGPLPATWRVTSRDDLVNGIRLYQVPKGLKWPGQLGPGVDVIQIGHRYVVAPPSVHPDTGETYRCLAADGTALPASRPMPARDELPWLPDSWVAGITRGLLATEYVSTNTTIDEFDAELLPGPACPTAQRLEQLLEAAIRSDDRHDRVRDLVLALVGAGAEGHAGVREVLEAGRGRFVERLAKARGGRGVAAGEWSRMHSGAVDKIGPRPLAVVSCDCVLPPLDANAFGSPGTTGDAAGEAGAAPAPAAAPSGPRVLLPNLPAEFWRYRPVFEHVKAAADARMASPDAVLGCLLARLSSFIPPKVRVDTGMGTASLNTFALTIGTSSAGKSRAQSIAKALLPVPLDVIDYRDALPLGSGEGLAEAYYGVVEREEGTGEVYGPRHEKAGEPKLRRVVSREKVRDHASFYLDEGEALSKMLERSGATIGQVIRTAWIGDTLGQANGTADRLRIVEGGTYAMGLVIGFQRATVGPLLADQGGTPQRFLFMSAHRYDPPGERTPWPGPIGNVTHAIPTSDLVLPESARDELWQARRAAMLPDAADEGLNGHWPLHMAKLAALFAVLDLRAEVTEDDWGLARVVWGASCAVRDALLLEARQEAARRAESEDERAVRVQGRVALTSQRILEREEEAKLERLARWVWTQVVEKGVTSLEKRGGLNAAIDGGRRKLLPAALDDAVARGWVTVDESGALAAGESRPA